METQRIQTTFKPTNHQHQTRQPWKGVTPVLTQPLASTLDNPSTGLISSILNHQFCWLKSYLCSKKKHPLLDLPKTWTSCKFKASSVHDLPSGKRLHSKLEKNSRFKFGRPLELNYQRGIVIIPSYPRLCECWHPRRIGEVQCCHPNPRPLR